MFKALKTVGRYIILMGRVFARPERMRMFFRQYVNELEQLGVNSIGPPSEPPTRRPRQP